MNPSRLMSRVILLVLMVLTFSSIRAQDIGIPTPTATPAIIELNDGWQLSDQTTTEEQPHLSTKMSIPVLTGPDSDVAANFNQAVETIVSENVDSFRDQNVELEAQATLPPEIAELGSFFELTYQGFTANSDLISIRFTAFFYSAGAAHPGSYTIPLNYDLANGVVLALADLFKPNTQYLELLSIYAIQSLNQTDGFMFPEGAEPIVENYRSWNITPDGLLITFDAYQVGPYAAGPMEVIVSYSAMAGMINPNGPLSSFISTGSVSG